jgi:hypothetical protein
MLVVSKMLRNVPVETTNHAPIARTAIKWPSYMTAPDTSGLSISRVKAALPNSTALNASCGGGKRKRDG